MRPRRIAPKLLLLLLLSALALPSGAGAESPPTSRGPSTTPAAKGVREADTPYCGVLSLYAGMRLWGRELPFDELLKPQYVSSQKGSTPADLERAAADAGFETLTLRNLSPGDLGRLRYPVILFTRYDEATADYNHYVLYVRTTADGVVLVDGSQGVHTVPPRDLPRTWGGVGMILSPDPIDEGVLVSSGVRRIATLGTGCIVLAGGLLLLSRWRPLCAASTRGPWTIGRIAGAQGGAILAAAGLVAVAYHRVEPSGFLASPNATAALDQAFAPLLLPSVTVAEARAARAGGAVLVDARIASDFVAGHIDGSISVPVGSNAEARRAALAAVPKDAQLVLFCKSAECGYSLEVAKGLLRDGYANLKMFRGGWDEWSNTYGTAEASGRQSAGASNGG